MGVQFDALLQLVTALTENNYSLFKLFKRFHAAFDHIENFPHSFFIRIFKETVIQRFLKISNTPAVSCCISSISAGTDPLTQSGEDLFSKINNVSFTWTNTSLPGTLNGHLNTKNYPKQIHTIVCASLFNLKSNFPTSTTAVSIETCASSIEACTMRLPVLVTLQHPCLFLFPDLNNCSPQILSKIHFLLQFHQFTVFKRIQIQQIPHLKNCSLSQKLRLLVHAFCCRDTARRRRALPGNSLPSGKSNEGLSIDTRMLTWVSVDNNS